MTGHADGPVFANPAPGLGTGHVGLAHVHPVAVEARGQVGVVIQDQRGVMRPGDGPQHLDRLGDLGF